MKLMVSSAAWSQWGERIQSCFQQAAAQGQSLEVLTITQALSERRRDIDVAFISRDVTGTSTKHRIAPDLQACYDLLRANAGLGWVHIHSAGADRPVFIELHQRGVAVTTSSGANAQVVAATALGGLLALARRFPMLWTEQQHRQWTPLLSAGRMPRDLPGQRATIVGWGPIGQTLARLLIELGLQVTAVRTRPDSAPGQVKFTTYADLADVLPATDWLILACPLTATTRSLVNAPLLSRLPQGAHLINVARGEVVDEAALIDALQGGHLGGAFLDVFCQEPLPADSALWTIPNVIITPHAAGHSDGNEARVAEMFLGNLQRWITGQPLLNRVQK